MNDNLLINFDNLGEGNSNSLIFAVCFAVKQLEEP